MPVPTAIAVYPAEHPLASTPLRDAYGPSRRIESFVQRAANFFMDNELNLPAEDHLELIVRFALRAQEFFFASALYLPEQLHLDHFFDEFVRLCAIATPPLVCDSTLDGGGRPATCSASD